MHQTYKDQLNPITKEADIGKVFDYKDRSRMWTTFTDEEGTEIITRVGWWGDEYDLLSNNCCFLTDHMLKILVGKPLPSWVFSLAKIGDSMAHGAHFMIDGTVDGLHHMVKGIGSIASGIGSLVGGKQAEPSPEVRSEPRWFETPAFL